MSAAAHHCRLRRLITVFIASMAFAAAPAGATTLPAGFAETELASGFAQPVAATWAPDGRMFVAEKNGRVRVVNPGSSTPGTLLDIQDKVNARSDRGMLGIATDKDFATNHWLYLLYVKELTPAVPDSDGPMVSVLTRVTVNPDNTLVNPASPETTILGKADSAPCPTPNNSVDCIPADYKWHTIGTVRSDPVDGTLWVGTGDTHANEIDATSYRPYDENTYAGKILHIDRDGRGLPNHPFCPADSNLDHVCTKIYAKGFRNPFRFSLRPGKGPVVGDVGNSAEEELDLIQPGKSYGWPCYEGNARTPLYQGTARCAQEYAKEGTADAHVPPAWSYAHAGGASITGGPVYAGANYPAEYRGDIFVGDYVQQWVKRIEIDANDNVTGVHDFGTGWSTGVDIEPIPGTQDLAFVDIGWGSNPPSVRRWSYADGNGIPTPRASATPDSGPAPLTVQFRGDTSSDPEGTALSYDWDFGDGSPHSSAANPSHTYSSSGSYTARLTVDDGTGRNPSTTVDVQVGGNTAPVATITAPADESLYRDGQAVSVSGSATDAEDGALPGSSLSWHVLLHHGTHIHDLTQFAGSSGSFTPVTDHDADSFYEIRLTATDSGGRSHTKVVEVRPETRRFTLASSPAGAPLGYGGEAVRPAPYTKTAAVGFRSQITAAQSFVKDGVTYAFKGWSDGGEREHVVTIPASDTTLTATYEPQGTPETVTFTPVADTYVDDSAAAGSFGSATSLHVDGSPTKQSLMRFPVSGVSGRTVTRVRLRVHQTGWSPDGGDVFALATNAWSESTTWNDRPAVAGSPLASFGAVTPGAWYEVELPASLVTADGHVSLALGSGHNDGNSWASRETSNSPQLIVEMASGEEPPPPPPPPPPPEAETLTFTPAADTSVDSSQASAGFGSSTSLYVDRSPAKESFIRFPVSGLDGRSVTSVRLRLFQKDGSPSGGRVFSLGTNAWSESMTWDSRPAIGGFPLATFGAVTSGQWYELELPTSVVAGDGDLSLALDSRHSDGVKWASRETATAPELVVEVGGDEEQPPPEAGGLSMLAPAHVGSSQPSYYAANHRMARTDGGRTLAVFGVHDRGVALAWRDAGGAWQSTTRGAMSDGMLLDGTGTGDWPASIATARDAAGREHAWVVWSAPSASREAPVQMRRLTGLDSPEGPSVGPLVTVDSPALGAFKADIGFERAPDGSMRGVLAWSRKASTSPLYEVATAWFTDLGSDTPAFTGRKVITSSSSSNRYVTLVPGPGGMRALQRGNSSRLRFVTHSSSAALTSWSESSAGPVLDSHASPAGIVLDSGEMLATGQLSIAGGTVAVQRWSADGSDDSTDLELTGYQQPSLATDGSRAWLVMVRESDGYVVSREYNPSAGWSGSDRVEIGADGGGGHEWPNLVREVDGNLRLLVSGTGSGPQQSSVLAFQRSTDATVSMSSARFAPVLRSTEIASSELDEEGALVTYSLSKRASVVVQLERRGQRGRWRKLRRGVRAPGRRGRNRVRVHRRFGGKSLRRGRYRLAVEATDRRGNTTRSGYIRFRVVRQP